MNVTCNRDGFKNITEMECFGDPPAKKRTIYHVMCR